MQAEEADAATKTTAAVATTQAAPPTTAPLFGGALRAAIPPRLADVSLARPVPDHQEVFSDPSADQALVIEVLEHDSAGVPDGEGAARFYFNDLVEQNEASEGARLGKVEALKSCSSSSLPLLRGLAASPAPPSSSSPSASSALDACSCAALAVGTASIAKGGSRSPEQLQKKNAVSLALALLRFPAVGSDLLVSLTTATALGDDSSSSVVPAEDPSGRGSPAEIAEEAERLLLSIVASLEVRDWGLFG